MQPLNLQSSSSSNKRKTSSKEASGGPGGVRKRPKSNEDFSMPPQLQPQAPIPTPSKDQSGGLNRASLGVAGSIPPSPLVAGQPTLSSGLTNSSASWKPPGNQTSAMSGGSNHNPNTGSNPNNSSSITTAATSVNLTTDSPAVAAPPAPVSGTTSQQPIASVSDGFMESFRSFVTTSKNTVDNEYAYGKIAKGKSKIKSENQSDTVSVTSGTSASNQGPPATGTTPVKNENPPSPVPSVCPSNASSSSTNHTKLKKAWLQRHSETEDKKNNTGTDAVVSKTTSSAKDQIKVKNENDTAVAPGSLNNHAGNQSNATTSIAASDNSDSSSVVAVKPNSKEASRGQGGSRSNSSTPPNVQIKEEKEEDSTSSSSETEHEMKKRKTTRVSRKRTPGVKESSVSSSKRQKQTSVSSANNNENNNSGDDTVSTKKEESSKNRKSPAPDKDSSSGNRRRGRKPKGRGVGNGTNSNSGDEPNKKKTRKYINFPVRNISFH